jgi:hypothetical protein
MIKVKTMKNTFWEGFYVGVSVGIIVTCTAVCAVINWYY